MNKTIISYINTNRGGMIVPEGKSLDTIIREDVSEEVDLH